MYRENLLLPIQDMFGLTEEALVVPHEHQRIELVCDLKRYTDHNQDAGGTEGGKNVDVQYLEEYGGNDCDNHEEESAEHGQTAALLLEILRGGTARTDAGNEAAVLLEILRNLNRVKGDGGVEVSEANDEECVDKIVNYETPGIVAPCTQPFGNPSIVLAVGPELSDHCRNLKDGHCEDQGHNAVSIGLEGYMCSIAAVGLPADNALCILDGDPAFCLVNGGNADNEDENDCDNGKDVPPVILKRNAAAVSNGLDSECTVDEVDNDLRNGGYDGSEDQDGNTVADALLGDPLAHPHQECGTCGAAETNGDVGHNAVHEYAESAGAEDGNLFKQVAHAVETDNDTYGLDKCETNADIAGDPFDLHPTVVFLAELLKSGERNGEELQDNGSRDVGRNTHRKDGELAQRAAGEQIEEVEEVILGNHASECCRVNSGNGDERTETVHDDEEERVQHLGAKILYLPGIDDRLKHLDHLNCSAHRCDSFLGCLRNLCCFNCQTLCKLATAQNLEAVLLDFADDAHSLEQFSSDDRIILEDFEVGDVDNGIYLHKVIVEATLRETTGQGHLAAFESVLLASAAGLLTLVTITGSLADTGAGATADALSGSG